MYLGDDLFASGDPFARLLCYAIKYLPINHDIIYRFMPDGIYLNAIQLGQKKLVRKMIKLINNFEEYLKYFKWRNHYSYHNTLESAETDEFCKFCAILNEEERVNNITIYEHFKKWWNPSFRC